MLENKKLPKATASKTRRQDHDNTLIDADQTFAEFPSSSLMIRFKPGAVILNNETLQTSPLKQEAKPGDSMYDRHY